MSDDTPPPTVLDAPVLSNLSTTDGVWLARTALPRPVAVPAVVREIRNGREEGYSFLDEALETVDDGIPIVNPPSPVPEEFASPLDAGEATVVHLAFVKAGTVVSDDGDARELAHEYEIPVAGSLGIPARGVSSGDLDLETADDWLATWRTAYGYRSPVESVANILPE